jgi:hypothetical protein
MVKYEKEILKIFEEMYEDWYDEDDKKEFNRMMLEATNQTMQSMSDNIQIGVDNGYSVEEQIEIAKVVYSKL